MTRRRVFVSLILSLTITLLSPGTGSASLIYDVKRTIGAGSVTGTITTDGTLGQLATGNFIDWQLTLDDGLSSFTLFGPNNVNSNSNLLLTSNSFIASATSLVFDFGAPGLALFQSPRVGSGRNWWCLDGTQANCSNGPNGDESLRVRGLTERTQQQLEPFVVASIVAPVQVPEPASLAFFGFGFAGLALVGRRKRIA